MFSCSKHAIALPFLKLFSRFVLVFVDFERNFVVFATFEHGVIEVDFGHANFVMDFVFIKDILKQQQIDSFHAKIAQISARQYGVQRMNGARVKKVYAFNSEINVIL